MYIIHVGPVGISAATNVTVSTEVDKRPGFFGHAILTITWEHPPGDMTTPHTIIIMYIAIPHLYRLCRGFTPLHCEGVCVQ